MSFTLEMDWNRPGRQFGAFRFRPCRILKAAWSAPTNALPSFTLENHSFPRRIVGRRNYIRLTENSNEVCYMTGRIRLHPPDKGNLGG